VGVAADRLAGNAPAWIGLMASSLVGGAVYLGAWKLLEKPRQ
jgi:hypothetical protein